MGLALEFLLNLFDPFHIIRRHFWNPFKTIAANVFDHFMNKTQDKVSTIRDVILRIGFVAFMVALIIWSAIFMYVTFYYAYMPAMSHTRPVHMQFKTCLDQGGPCSFPHAHVSLTKKQQLLMMGQAYRVQVIIDMPESIQNQELGMFMVCGELRDQESYLRGHACRTALMKYKSQLIRTISTWSLGPLYILGLKEEHERIYVEIFPRYLEERNHPITDVYIEIQSHKIQFYSVTLQITADFTGLRYIMFNYPWMSAAVGVSTNLVFILIILILSWYHWSDTTWIKEAADKYREHKKTIRSGTRSRAPSAGGSRKHSESDKSLQDDESFDNEDIAIIGETSKSQDILLGGDYVTHTNSSDDEDEESESQLRRRKVGEEESF